MSNSELLENVKTWLEIDNQIRALQKEIKERRKIKKDLTLNLVQIMKTNNVEQLNIPDGELIYTHKKVKAPLSKKHLLASLSLYFKNDARIVDELGKYIMNSRKDKEKENIKRKIKK